MTYEKYIATSRKMQLRYIADEQKRNAKLMKLWRDYQAKASKIGFHAHDRREIEARSDQLRLMAARIDETHGDTPAMRAWYRDHQVSKVPA